MAEPGGEKGGGGECSAEHQPRNLTSYRYGQPRDVSLALQGCLDGGQELLPRELARLPVTSQKCKPALSSEISATRRAPTQNQDCKLENIPSCHAVSLSNRRLKTGRLHDSLEHRAKRAASRTVDSYHVVETTGRTKTLTFGRTRSSARGETGRPVDIV
jgi:hypothetical protein